MKACKYLILAYFLHIYYTICMSKNIIKARTCLYNINYHMVWSVKYRHKVLDEKIEKRLKEIIYEIADEKEFVIHEIEVGENDHVHLFVSAHPKYSISYIAKMLKGISARRLLMEFPEIKSKLWNGQMWNPSFFVETVGSVSEEAIKKYIVAQKKG